MSLEKLIKLVPPPETDVPAREEDIEAVERRFGPLPADYMRIILQLILKSQDTSSE